MVGISVINASELPGQLAELINDARTTTHDAKKLTRHDRRRNDLLHHLHRRHAARTGLPGVRQCEPRPAAGHHGHRRHTHLRRCSVLESQRDPTGRLRPTLQFLVEEQGGTTITQSPTIGYRDAATGAATTARLSKNWFITQRVEQPLKDCASNTPTGRARRRTRGCWAPRRPATSS